MKWRKGDFVIAAAVILIAVGIWLFPFARGERATKVEIYSDGKLSYTHSMYGEFEEEVSGCTVKLSDGKVSVSSATCPDKVCVRTGEISKSGEIIVCVPNRVSVKISGEEEFDAVAN